MATEIKVPTLGESVTEATVGKWFKKVGDAVAADEPLVELETDKVTIEVPAPGALKVALRKAGGPQVADIDKASVQKVFTPRSTPHPGSEEALRRVVAGYASGTPDYAVMAPDVATQVRDALPALRHSTLLV